MAKPIKEAGFSLRLLPEDRAKLKELSDRWQTNGAGVVERLIREAYQREQQERRADRDRPQDAPA